jgi:hypothetical protein
MTGKDFFISYNRTDSRYAVLIKEVLEELEYSVAIDIEMLPGDLPQKWIQEELLRAKRMIALLSPGYYESEWTDLERQIAGVRDPAGNNNSVIPIMVEKCELEGRFSLINFFDLTEYDERQIKRRLKEVLSKIRPARTPSTNSIEMESDDSRPEMESDQQPCRRCADFEVRIKDKIEKVLPDDSEFKNAYTVVVELFRDQKTWWLILLVTSATAAIISIDVSFPPFVDKIARIMGEYYTIAAIGLLSALLFLRRVDKLKLVRKVARRAMRMAFDHLQGSYNSDKRRFEDNDHDNECKAGLDLDVPITHSCALGRYTITHMELILTCKLYACDRYFITEDHERIYVTVVKNLEDGPIRDECNTSDMLDAFQRKRRLIRSNYFDFMLKNGRWNHG